MLFFLLNLQALTVTLHYLKGKDNSDSIQCKIVNASVSLGLVACVGIFIFHGYLQAGSMRCFERVKRIFKIKTYDQNQRQNLFQENEEQMDQPEPPSTTIVDLWAPTEHVHNATVSYCEAP